MFLSSQLERVSASEFHEGAQRGEEDLRRAPQPEWNLGD